MTPPPPKCLPPGGDRLQFDGTKWICGCTDGWTGSDCEYYEGIHYFNLTDPWYRSPFLYDQSDYPDTTTILSYIKNMTKCAATVHKNGYTQCPNPTSDWREARITYQNLFKLSNLLSPGCGLTSENGTNTGTCMYWRCDNTICGGNDSFYGQNKYMLIVSDKYYRLEKDYSYNFQTWILGTARFFLNPKGTNVIKEVGNEISTRWPTWNNPQSFISTSTSTFNIIETGDYRIIISLKADSSGAMFNLQSLQKTFMDSYQISSYYFYYGSRYGCANVYEPLQQSGLEQSDLEFENANGNCPYN
jgi:hypothetical protein